MEKSEKGVTLVEVLAALLLVSLIAGIAWTALTIGMKHSAAETSKTQLQQEANLIVTTLVNEHRRSDHYYLRLANGQLEINSCDADGAGIENCNGFKKITQQDFLHKGSVNGTDFALLDETNRILPKKNHVKLVLKVTDLQGELEAEVETKLTRILTDR